MNATHLQTPTVGSQPASRGWVGHSSTFPVLPQSALAGAHATRSHQGMWSSRSLGLAQSGAGRIVPWVTEALELDLAEFRAQLPLINCVVLAKLPNLPNPQFCQLQNGNKNIHFVGLLGSFHQEVSMRTQG